MIVIIFRQKKKKKNGNRNVNRKVDTSLKADKINNLEGVQIMTDHERS